MTPGAEQTSGHRGGQAASSVPATALKAELGWNGMASFSVRSVPRWQDPANSHQWVSARSPCPRLRGRNRKPTPTVHTKPQGCTASEAVRRGTREARDWAERGSQRLQAPPRQRQGLAFGGSALPLITDRSCLLLSQGKGFSLDSSLPLPSVCFENAGIKWA